MEKSNKIRDIVRLQQLLKKWKKFAVAKRTSSSGSDCTDVAAATATATATNSTLSSSRSMKFLKKTLSFSDSSPVPKGYVAVCVGKDEKRFVIPTEYLSHQVFAILLREAEEEFGFQQQGVLKLPCEVDLFERIMKMMEHDDKSSPNESLLRNRDEFGSPGYISHQHLHSQSQMCR